MLRFPLSQLNLAPRPTHGSSRFSTVLGGACATVSSRRRRLVADGVQPPEEPHRHRPGGSLLRPRWDFDATGRPARRGADQRTGRGPGPPLEAADRGRLGERGPGGPRGRATLRRSGARGRGGALELRCLEGRRRGVRQWPEPPRHDLTFRLEPRAERSQPLFLPGLPERLHARAASRTVRPGGAGGAAGRDHLHQQRLRAWPAARVRR